MSVNKSVSLPDDIYLKLKELAAKENLTFSCAIGKMLAKAFMLDQDEHVVKAYNTKHKPMKDSDYGMIKLKKKELPLPKTFSDFLSEPIRPTYHYEYYLTPLLDAKFEVTKYTSDFTQIDPVTGLEAIVKTTEFLPPTTEEKQKLRELKERYAIRD